jgi:K+/H+ antiporter YhaU regulatory subunit KhtT
VPVEINGVNFAKITKQIPLINLETMALEMIAQFVSKNIGTARLWQKI